MGGAKDCGATISFPKWLKGVSLRCGTQGQKPRAINGMWDRAV